jgi:hypothetical protein
MGMITPATITATSPGIATSAGTLTSTNTLMGTRTAIPRDTNTPGTLTPSAQKPDAAACYRWAFPGDWSLARRPWSCC